jgi:preprotein translocase subunit SecG
MTWGEGGGTEFQRVRQASRLPWIVAIASGVVALVVLVVVVVLVNSDKGGSPSASQAKGASQQTSQQAGSGKWTDPVVVITPTSLGAVKIGMSLTEASAAAGVTIKPVGDGVNSGRGQSNGPELYMQIDCVGVSGGTRTYSQVVETPQGVRLGDSADRITAMYGDRAQYVPQPQGGRTPAEGYVVSFDDGKLAFAVYSNIIVAIHAGRDVTPSNCGG